MVASAVNSLVFDCEVPLSTDDAMPRSSSGLVVDLELISQRLEMLSRPPCPFARELRSHVHRIMRELQGQSPSARILGSNLALAGFTVTVRTALSGQGAECFKSLRHEFLVVRGSGEYSGMEFIVEPSLRQHFAIPHPTPEYAFALAAAPDVFVGGSCRLVSIVQLLCALMADSFERQGLPLPPWRREAAMISKWVPQPNRIRDVALPVLGLQLPQSPQALHHHYKQQGQHQVVPADWSRCASASVPADLHNSEHHHGQDPRDRQQLPLPMRETTYGYLPAPAVVDSAVGPSEVVQMWRADSDSSNGSSVVGGACDMMGCSPISVLPLPQRSPHQQQQPLRKQLGFGSAAAVSATVEPPVATTSGTAPGEQTQPEALGPMASGLQVVWGFNPAQAATTECATQRPERQASLVDVSPFLESEVPAVGKTMAGISGAPAEVPESQPESPEQQHQQQIVDWGFLDCYGRHSSPDISAVDKQQQRQHMEGQQQVAATSQTAAAFGSPGGRGGGGTAAGKAGLLAQRLQQSAQSAVPAGDCDTFSATQARGTTTDARSYFGTTAGHPVTCAAVDAGGDAGSIRTRPPVHRGEMAIRVVKLRHQQPSVAPQQQGRQSAKQQQAVAAAPAPAKPGAHHLPWRPFLAQRVA